MLSEIERANGVKKRGPKKSDLDRANSYRSPAQKRAEKKEEMAKKMKSSPTQHIDKVLEKHRKPKEGFMIKDREPHVAGLNKYNL